MACDLTAGMKLSCKDQRGGIKLIDFAVFEDYGFTVANEAIATLPVSLTEVFRYEVKATVNTLTETATVSVDNRTTEIIQALAVNLPKLTAERQVQMKAILSGRTVAFVHDYNGNVHVLGIETGVDATTGTKVTGGAGGDLSGYTVALQAMSSSYSPFLAAGAITALAALVSDEVVDA